MADQLSIFEIVDEEEIVTASLFAPNGKQRCEHCRRPLTAWAGRLYCLSVGCSGVSR
jgi:hypothetical protein